ncbi:MAG: type IX secretion system sortase PorU, partial [Flavobacteriaceae bacterium]|nr:type IX secretion system sortase PorU [Flavobacteriaceae bacterium]
MNKIKHLFIIVLLSFSDAYSQNNVSEKIVLEWSDKTLVLTNRGNKVQTPTIENQFIDADLLPIYTKSWKISSGYSIDSYKITNIQYQTISSNSFEKASLTKIPISIKSELNVAKSRDESEIILALTPLIKEGALIKKVVSFSITYKLKRTLSNRLTTLSNVSNSVLATGNWYKFSIDTTGVFKINRSFLQSLGINTASINPKNIKIYGNGGAMLPFRNSDFRYDDLEENAILVIGEEDNSFDSSDYILFYAKGPDAWKVDILNTNNTGHQKNIFADESYYFITVDGGTGKRIQDSAPIITTANQNITSFNDYNFYEKEERNLFTIGRQWFGESFSIENTQTFTIPFNNIDTSQDISIRVRGVVISGSASSMTVKVNGQDLYTISFVAALGLDKAVARDTIASITASGESVVVEITFDNNGNPSAKAYLDYIEVIGKKQLVANEKQFGFRSFDVANSTGVAQYTIQNGTTIWDVTDYVNPVKITNQSATGNFEFNANSGMLREYISLNEADFYTPKRIQNSVVENQNLHALVDIDYVIVTRDYLMNEVERLATYHRDRGLTVEVVNLEKIYNEFSSGSPDLTAIRDFVKHLYDNATTPEKRIKYLCLFGDASYDYKDRINGNNNIVPALQSYQSFNLATSYVTDDYYGMMDANEGLLVSTDRQDVITGRIPVTDVVQASDAINKIINYNSINSFGDWRNQVVISADDIDANFDISLQFEMEKIADTIKDRKPILNVKKIYLDAYVQEASSGGERYPDVKDEISNVVEGGILLFNYYGHGGEDGWAGERVLEIPQVRAWRNYNTLPLIVTITCEFSKFDNPLRLAGGEFLIWNKDGGSISLITTTREIYIGVGRTFNERLMKLLLAFNGEDYTIAEVLMNVKNGFGTSQRLFIYYLGDPAMKLAVPKADIRLTHMNGTDISVSLDTIKALSHVSFDGIVTDSQGSLLTDFNGELSVTVFDKEINRTTLDNDNFGIFMEFDALESKIFRGRAAVENGLFTFDFIAPRDLRIAYGKGKLSFYADNDIIDKAGYNFDVTIGGINENAPEDNIGPEIQLFMNDESFVDGGNTNASPLFLAVLEDESGINTSITAVDHDIVAVLDGDTANPFILNDYYQTELNDYTKGKVKYPLRNLEAGLHTIKLCAWDTYNNTSCATLSFVVVSDADMVLDNVLNYPNPFINHTEFWFNHNKPNEPLEVQIQIFTVSGKLVKTINQLVQSTGN